jgi:transformation/transcription domain-associated protein
MAVLLGPLKSLFKVEVGTKLLDHFRFLADPQTLQGTSGTVLTENNEIKKLAGLANIFYLLPSNAGVYLEDLTNAIVNTEAYFDMFSPTPFTVPLSHFLDAYPEEGTTYFLKNLQFARHLRTARNVLQARLAQRFQSLLATRTSVIVTDFLASTEVVRVIAGLSLCTDLADVNTSWLTDHPEIVEALLVIWRHERLQPSANTLESRQKCLLVLKLLKKGLEETPRVDLLFDVVVVFSRDLPIDTIQTSRFLYDHVALRGDLQLQRNILSRFVTWIEGPAPWTDKCHFLRFVLTPMLQVHVTRFPKEGLLDSDVISCLFRCFWNPETEQKKEDMKAAGQVFLVELLHLTSVIVAHYSYLLDPYKKELVVFIWSHLGSQETIIKQCAHILAARFLDAFDAPAKFITATLTGLLKPAEGDPKKTLTEQGLEVLVKVFPRMEPDEQSHPHWATAIRRMLSEEGISAQQTTSIYSFIVRHADVFYPVRSSFAPHMVYSINRLGFFGTQNPDARLLILDIIEVLFNWEKRTMEVIESSDSMQVDGGNSSDHEPWMMSVTSRENVVSYLVRLAGTFIGDSTGPRIHFAPKALALTKQVLGAGGWTNVTVKPAYYSRPLEVTYRYHSH